VKGELGSTQSTLTSSNSSRPPKEPRSSTTLINWSVRVDLPAPGGPVIPTT
jgi:hypothetical protein